MDLYTAPEWDAHERIVYGHDAGTGLRAIIAVHSSTLGPAFGGCRIWPYDSSAAALTDVLRLSQGMSYKNALAGLPFGGGKSVIIADPRREKTPALMRAFGRLVDSLGGLYITAEDVGSTLADMTEIAAETRYVSGHGTQAGAAGGDPSPLTALGVFLGIEAAVRYGLGRDSLEGVTVAVQGLGGVGRALCERLAGAGARLRVADLRAEAVTAICDELGAKPVAVDAVLYEDVDVVSPCALGAVLGEHSIARLRARIVAGAANNQLALPADGARLLHRGIVYAPDYVINAGGIISVGREYLGGYTRDEVVAEIEGIPARLTEILTLADAESRPTSEIADALARKRLARPARRIAA